MKKTALIVAGLLTTISSMEASQDARKILEISGVQGGLVVVIGCDSPELLEGLRAGDSYVVHGLDRDPSKVTAARVYLREKGLYGSVTASQWDGSQLPFVDSLVNLLVMRDTGCEIRDEEIDRVLAPGGVAIPLQPPVSSLRPFEKSWPNDIDEWSHFLHDASNNAVSSDTVVEPPKGLRWTCGPAYARSHEHFSSMSAMVTAGGRIFYIIDEGPISSVYLPPQWKLVARDAFSGVLLWDRPITNWEAHLRGFRSGPPEIGRRLVATDDRIYGAFDYGESVAVLDAATGKELATVPNTDGARELLLTDGILFVLADDMTAAQHNERREAINQGFLRTSPELSIWQRLQRQAYPMYGTQRIVAIRTGDGSYGRIWNRQFDIAGEILPTTMAVDDGKVCLQTVSHVICLDATAGNELWRNERPLARSRFSWSTPTLVMHDGVVLILDRAASDNVGKSPPDEGSEWIVSSGGRDDRQGGELVTYSLDDGQELWRAAYSENYNTPGDIFVIDGVVWVGNLRGGGDPGFTEGRNLKTGEIRATIPPQKAWGHHRCYRNKATVRWLMVGRGGIQYIDPESGAVKGDSWYRGACQYGAMPANGMVYVPQHSCACQPEELLLGLNALSPRSAAGDGPPPLEEGPAFGSDARRSVGAALDRPPSGDGGYAGREPQPRRDWPTYRSDVRRSGYQDLAAPSEPRVAWTAKLSSPITAPVSADGLVLVAETDHHTLHALLAADGKSVWTFVADGRIDSPPTLSAGRCLFGTRNGFVYCLRASDGAMIWRFRAAPQDRRIFAYEQLESAWPVHGSLLVDGDTIYVAAGRSARMDGGIRIHALDVRTGELVRKVDVRMTGGGGANVIRQSVLPDILSIKNDAVWMRGLGVNKNLAPVSDEPHLFAPRGFLDDTWWHRTYWVYGTKVGGGYSHWPDAGNAVPAGRLLVFDGSKYIYGYGRLRYRMGDGHVRANATEDYKLFAEVLAPEPQTRQDRRGETEQVAGRREIKWATNLPFVAKAIVLTRDALLVAGGGSLPDAMEQVTPGILWGISRDDGAKQQNCLLPAPPVLDGMALTDLGVFVSMTDGSLACLRSSRGKAESSRAENPETLNSPNAELLAQINAMDLPEGYTPGNAHQDYVDRRMAKLNPQQRARIGQPWKEKQRIHPNMPNRGFSFVRILAFVAGGEKPPSPQPSPDSGTANSDAGEQASAVEGPNVLFLAVDDLNDWVGYLGGHPQAKTPNIDRLASRGVLFEQAYCSSPLCNPSRMATMTGLRASTIGVWGNGGPYDRPGAYSWFRDKPEFKDWVTIPQYFRQHGYTAVTGGKIFHQAHGKFSDPVSWDHQYSTKTGTPFPKNAKRLLHGMSGKFTNNYYNDWADWMPLEIPASETADWKTAEGAAEFLRRDHDKPFFLACGIFRPHLRWYAPRKYFEMHPLEEIKLPVRLENDLDDVPPMGRRMAGQAFSVIHEHGQWKNAVQGYLASCSFADACIGVVLDALYKSDYAENTIVVLWGDHGFHIGEKNHISKLTLWEEGSQTPLIISAPELAATRGKRCKRPVSLVDLYPTLVELCRLPARDGLDGRSIAPLVRDPESEWRFPAVIDIRDNHAVRSQRWHYIRYADGGEELYDMPEDPHQWENLANDDAYSEVKEQLNRWLPKENVDHFQTKNVNQR